MRAFPFVCFALLTLACRAPVEVEGASESTFEATATEAPPAVEESETTTGEESSSRPTAPDAIAELPSRTRRRELARTLASEPGWNLFESRHYFIATPVDDPLLIDGIKGRLDTQFARLEREFPGPQGAARRTSPLVRVHPDRQAFFDAGGQPGTTSFWVSSEHTLVLYDAGSDEGRKAQTWPALQHIVVHEYFDTVLGITPAPPWLLYGIAAHYEALRFFQVRGGANSFHLPADTERWDQLAQQTAGGAPPPLGRLLAFDREEFHGRNEFGSGGYRNLILAWSFVEFLGDDQAPPEARADFLRRYLASLLEENDAGEALRAALAGAELAALDLAWRQWIEAKIGRELGSR